LLPRLPQRSFLYAVLRPLGAALAVAGLVLALGSPSGAGIRTASAHSAGLDAPAPHTLARPVISPAHVARSLQRTGWVRPVPGPVTSWFGRRWGHLHPGIDIGAPYGTPVHAITSGRILSAGWIAGYGKTVLLSSWLAQSPNDWRPVPEPSAALLASSISTRRSSIVIKRSLAPICRSGGM